MAAGLVSELERAKLLAYAKELDAEAEALERYEILTRANRNKASRRKRRETKPPLFENFLY